MEKLHFKAVLTQFTDSPLWGWHFLVPNNIACKYTNGKDRRVICTINDTLTLHCALMPNKNNWFVMLNNANVKKLKLVANAEIQTSRPCQ